MSLHAVGDLTDDRRDATRSDVSPYSPQPPYAPPPPPRGTSAFIWLAVLAGLGMAMVFVGLIAFGAYRGMRDAQTRTVASAHASSRSLPQVTRHVPHHPISILDGCSDADTDRIAVDIGAAINVGAPLYNAGNFAGCYHMYDGAAADLERKLSASCKGAASALRDGRDRASSLRTADEQAWAMRDAFDGLTNVIERRQGSD